jgi:hypothetical protein
MRSAEKTIVLRACALLIGAAFAACSYDFDSLVAQTGAGGAAGTGGTAGASGAAGSGGAAGDDGSDAGGAMDGSGGAAGTGGASGSGGTDASGSGGTGPDSGARDGGGGTAVDAGKDGNAGKGGTADAASDRAPDAIADVRAEPAFDCTAVNGTVYQGHCFYPSSAMTNWDTAKTTGCAAPSHLAVITSAGEQGAVAGLLVGKDRWIGLNKDPGSPNMESSFHWVTGAALTYKTWDSYETGAPEPNYTGDCVRMRPTNNWGDTPCTDSYVAVCERD